MIALAGRQLRNPDFGDTDTSMYNRINRVTRGGDRVIEDPFEPNGRRMFRYTWSSLKEEEADTVKFILANTVGLRITLVDYNGDSYPVVILNPETEVAQVSVNSWSASIDMQVVP